MLVQHRNHVLDTLTLLVNSCPPASDTDTLQDISAIEKFIKERTITEVEKLTTFEIGQLQVVRNQFRAIFTAPDDKTKVSLVNGLLNSARITPRLVEHDHLGVHFHYFPPYASLSEHLASDCSMALATLIDSGGADRLRVCSGKNCSRVFVDYSRNASRTYCSSKTCGARVHAAAYRKRKSA
jgi:predicted RNA-binding Zn ribbon-like protein